MRSARLGVIVRVTGGLSRGMTLLEFVVLIMSEYVSFVWKHEQAELFLVRSSVNRGGTRRIPSDGVCSLLLRLNVSTSICRPEVYEAKLREPL